VAQAHYLQVRDSDYENAAREDTGQATQKATQQAAAPGGTGPQTQNGHQAQAPDLLGVAQSCGSVQNGKVTPTGFEPVLRP
jgi:hypothetical protein